MGFGSPSRLTAFKLKKPANHIPSRYMSTSSSISPYYNVPLGPRDTILGFAEKFSKDQDSKKVDLTIGAYRDEKNLSYVFPTVRKAEKILAAENLSMDYLPIHGNQVFIEAVLELLYGADSPVIKQNKVAAIQSLSGTGALSVAFRFIKKFFGQKIIYLSTPTYANHWKIIKDCGLNYTKQYAYYDEKTNGLKFSEMMNDLKNAEPGSVILLQAVAHNPTGIDPSNSQWQEISKIVKQKRMTTVFDLAYQGFASGDTDEDAFSIRTFVADSNPIIVCQSFAKNFGLYGHRTGALSITTAGPDETARVLSQLKILVRSSYSNPPLQGARLIEKILTSEKMASQWKIELKNVVERIKKMRGELKAKLVEKGSVANWSHITAQRGMFCYTGLNWLQMKKLREEWHVYGTDSGRISVPGLNEGNLDYVAEAICAVSR